MQGTGYQRCRAWPPSPACAGASDIYTHGQAGPPDAARAENADPSGSRSRDAYPEQREPGWLSVHRHDHPAASQQLQRIGALAAAQVDRQAALARAELLACSQQERPRLTASRPCVVSSPVRAAIIDHSAIMPVPEARDNGFAVRDPSGRRA